MNERLRELMLEAGYAAPELAGRAQVLARLIVEEATDLVYDMLDQNTSGEVVVEIKQHFGVL